MINIEGLFHYYSQGKENETIALDGINLQINEGEFVVVLGHNGCGKSTLAKHLNSLLLPSKGDVIIDGLNSKDDVNLWEIRKRVGMVFQNPDNQLVATTVEEDIAFGMENLGIPQHIMKERISEVLNKVNMTESRNKPPHLLSGGQKQRIAIAGIIAMRPAYLVLDEPTAMLDPEGRREVIDTIIQLNKEEGLTIILITHFMEEAVLADRLVVMEQGKIVTQGSPREVFTKVEELKKLRLDIPQVTEIAYALNRDNKSFPADILTIEEMVDRLCQ